MKTSKLNLKQRNMSGAGIIMILTVIGLVILPLIAMFAFEVSRANLATQQLKNAADAAALGAVATMASQDNNDMTAAQGHARAVALKIFKQNSVLGNQLTDSSLAPGLDQNPDPFKGEIFLQFLDPNTLKPVPDGDPNGKIVRLTAYYGMVPAFGKFVGIGKQPIIASSNGAVPQLDVVVCFDISGSIDDQTYVSIRKRKYDTAFPPAASNPGVPGRIVYKIPTTNTMNCEGKIFDIVDAPPTGTGLNAFGLQNLTAIENSKTGANFAKLHFSEEYRSGGKGLRSGNVVPEDGVPPGNYPSGSPSYDADAMIFTDMVVNLDGKKTFAGFTDTNGYSFPNVETLIEASRGNLDSVALFNSSKASTSPLITVAPKAGYKAAYQKQAYKCLQPIQDAKDATTLFAQIINNDTDAHFGLVTFDDGVGTDENTTANHRQYDDNIGYGQSLPFPQPLIPLDKGLNQTQYTKVVQALGDGINNRPLVAKGSTNIGLAIKTAVDQIKNNGRTNAVKAIVLFTDGQPTSGGPFSGNVWTNARQAAVYARNAGIPVYTIGLATNAAIIPGETDILNASNTNPANGGIAGISGQGATFHLVTNSKDLRAAFEKIARHLVQLVRDQYNG